MVTRSAESANTRLSWTRSPPSSSGHAPGRPYEEVPRAGLQVRTIWGPQHPQLGDAAHAAYPAAEGGLGPRVSCDEQVGPCRYPVLITHPWNVILAAVPNAQQPNIVQFYAAADARYLCLFMQRDNEGDLRRQIRRPMEKKGPCSYDSQKHALTVVRLPSPSANKRTSSPARSRPSAWPPSPNHHTFSHTVDTSLGGGDRKRAWGRPSRGRGIHLLRGYTKAASTLAAPHSHDSERPYDYIHSTSKPPYVRRVSAIDKTSSHASEQSRGGPFSLGEKLWSPVAASLPRG
ncbi:hypothetical protein PG984_002683 [Apiospora sp. TS-2023a]